MPEETGEVQDIGTEESTQGQETQVEESGDREEAGEVESNEPQGATEETQGREEVQYTQKGTKLDSNPLSAAHQQLANERRIRQQYEQVLRNPDALRSYMERAGYTQKEIKEEQKARFTPDKIKSAEDLTNALNEIQGEFSEKTKAYEQKIQALEQTIGGFGQVRQVEAVASQMRNDIDTIRDKYPELNPKSSDYDPDLEKAVSNMYHQMDYDERSGSYTGRHSIAKVADSIMTAAKKAGERASKKTQTQVREKQQGKVVTSSKPTKDTAQSDDPATAIAQKVYKAING